jgi:hypothetical protein
MSLYLLSALICCLVAARLVLVVRNGDPLPDRAVHHFPRTLTAPPAVPPVLEYNRNPICNAWRDDAP